MTKDLSAILMYPLFVSCQAEDLWLIAFIRRNVAGNQLAMTRLMENQ